MQRLALLRQEIDQDVAALMGGRERKKDNAAALRIVHLHGDDEFDPPALCNLGRADRASPNAAASLKTRIA